MDENVKDITFQVESGELNTPSKEVIQQLGIDPELKDVKKRFLMVNFDSVPIPRLRETKNSGGDFYLPTPDNRYFADVLNLYWNSETLSQIIDDLHQRILLEININDKKWKEGEEEEYSKSLLDYLLYGMFSTQCIWSNNHIFLLENKHLDMSKVRCGLINEDNGLIEQYAFSNYWLKWGGGASQDIKYLPRFNSNVQYLDKNDKMCDTPNHQIYFYKRYSPYSDVYAKSRWYKIHRWCAIEIAIQDYYHNLLNNGMGANCIISVNQNYSPEDQEMFVRNIKEELTGPHSGGRQAFIFSDDKDHAPTIEKFNEGPDDEKYQWLLDKAQERISTGMNYPWVLFGQKVAGQLGQSSADDLKFYEDRYTQKTVIPVMNKFEKGWNILSKYMINQ